MRVDRVTAIEGLKKIEEQRYEDASRILNAGLKFVPQSAQLHFLNGFAYHLRYLHGEEASSELSATGYQLALEYDPAHYYAALQLGRLQLDSKRYGEAMDAFRRAAVLNARSGEAQLGLATAAYYAHEVDEADAAARRAATLMPDNPDAFRTLAMVQAARGDIAAARRVSARYATLDRNVVASSRLDARIDDWNAWHESARQAKEPSATSAATTGAQPPAPQPPQPGSPAPTPGAPDAATPAPDPAPPAAAQAAPQPAPDAQLPAPGSRSPAWFDCTNAPPPGAPPPLAGGGGDAKDADTAPLPALPSPCVGSATPRMVLLDVAFIRTEDTTTTSNGINLLQGLSLVFGKTQKIVDTITQGTAAFDQRQVQTVTSRTLGLGGPSTDAIVNYSLNIANATEGRSEVLARPSLTALDRTPSTFFSGRNLTIGVSGQAGGSSLLQDKPVGVSLAVTPTFVDDDTILLAVKTTRSFIQPVQAGVNFQNSFQTSRSNVSANVLLKMGQTLILSGLAEQEEQRSSTGVPVLKQIAGLQYLFGHRDVSHFTSSVLVLVTPRAPRADNEVLGEALARLDKLPAGQQRYRSMVQQTMAQSPGGAPPSLTEIYRHALANPLFLQFRAGDLAYQVWSRPDRMRLLFSELKELVW